jgi:hypothetical protein
VQDKEGCKARKSISHDYSLPLDDNVIPDRNELCDGNYVDKASKKKSDAFSRRRLAKDELIERRRSLEDDKEENKKQLEKTIEENKREYQRIKLELENKIREARRKYMEKKKRARRSAMFRKVTLIRLSDKINQTIRRRGGLLVLLTNTGTDRILPIPIPRATKRLYLIFNKHLSIEYLAVRSNSSPGHTAVSNNRNTITATSPLILLHIISAC